MTDVICQTCGEVHPLRISKGGNRYRRCPVRAARNGKKYRARYPDRQKKYRQQSREWMKQHPELHRVYRRVNYALNTGKLTKLPCEVCGSEKVVAHHEDYSRPLEVTWLCREHHGQRHREINEAARKLHEVNDGPE